MRFFQDGHGKARRVCNIPIALLALLISFVSPSLSLAEEQALDVAIIMDTSSSMGKTDPGKLRMEAAKLFVSLLGRKDRVALISFSGRAYPITRFLSLNDRKNEQKLLKSIDRLIANGKYTNLHDALLRGYELLTRKTQTNNAKHIILLSDGKMDLGNQARNLHLLEKTIEDLTPKLAQKNIKVHTLAFTKQSYVPLLKLVAQDTQGQFMLLDNPKGIHQVFENIFERAKLPEMIPLSEDSFVLDDAVEELTIVASKFKPYSNITLASPDGKDISRSHHNRQVKWFSAKQFDLITIKNPAKGYWLVKYSEGGNKVYILSDFKLEASTTKKKAEPGTPLQIQAFLSKKGKKLNRRSLLRTTAFKAKVTSPSGAVIENFLLDDGSEIGSERADGIYGISYAFDLEGTYKVEVTATGQTFDRKKMLFIDVVSIAPQRPFEKLKEERKKRAELKKQQAEEAAFLAAKEAEEKRQIAEAEAREAERLAEEKRQAEMSLENPNPSPESQEINNENTSDEGLSVGDMAFALILFILFLGSLSGGAYYYFIYRPKNHAKEKDDSNNAETAPPETKKTTANVEKSEIEPVSEGLEDLDLDIEESISSALSDLEIDAELEKELSSILETEMDKLK